MSEKTDAWMPLWIGAYTADTTHLTNTQHGAYILLIMAYWRRGAPLPDDDQDLADFAKASPRQWKALRRRMAQFFEVKDGLWRHKRIDQELQDASERRQKAHLRAQAAALARWGRASGNAASIPEAMPGQCPTPTPSPSPERVVGRDAHACEELATELAFGLRRRGVNITSVNLYLLHWLQEGYTPEAIHAALDIARVSKPEPAAMPAKYLDTVLRGGAPAVPAAHPKPNRSIHHERAETIAGLTGATPAACERAPLTLENE